MKAHRVFLAAAATGLAAIPCAAEAQVPDEYKACVTIDADADRLACYDAATGRARMSDAELEQVARKEAAENFGLPPERQQKYRKRFDFDTEVKSEIASLGSSGTRQTVTLANGQVWVITSGGRMQQFLKPGMPVSISEGAISGYRLKSDRINGMETVRRIK
ncbi:MAG: hypothetical protein R3D89_06775 [Sphingomonadaceae bacterium]